MRQPRACAVIGRLGTQADKSGEALGLLLGLLRHPTLAADRVAAARVALTREMVATRIPPRRIADWVQAWEERGEHEDPRPWELAQLQSLGPPELAGLLARFATVPAIISVLGDRTRLGPVLERFGTVVELHVHDVFPYAAPAAARGSRP